MANSKHKFIIKLKYLILLCCILILSLTIATNIILALSKSKVTQTLNNQFFLPVTVKNIFYLPPNFVVFNGLDMFESKIKTDKKVFNIPISYANFSLTNLFLSKNIDISSLHCIGFTTNLDKLVIFLKDNSAQIFNFLTRLPRRDFELTVKQITVNSTDKDRHSVKIKGGFNLKIEDNVASASGSVGESVFSFKGIIGQEQMVVEDFKLDSENINCQFRGKLSPDLVEFKGFILANSLNPPKKSSIPSILILDIDSRIKFLFPHLEIERLNFTINNNPVQITADILLDQPFSCNLKLFSNFRSMDYKQKGSLKNASFIASLSVHEDKTIKLNGILNIDFPERKKESSPLEIIELNAKDLVLNFKEFSAWKITAAELNLFSKTSTAAYNINLKDLQSEVRELGKNSKLIKFSSKFYDGLLRGRGYLEMHEFIPAISAVVKTEDVTASKLEGILINFPKINGKLSSQMSFINYPQLIFKGTIRVRDGSLNNFEFLKWLADSFDLTSLQMINFNTASTDFTVNKEGIEMFNIDLDSKNVKMKGYFKLKENDMVASKIFLSLPRELLEKSPKFTPLLKILDAKQELVKFNFQLSGYFQGMNFQWLKSEFKDDLQKIIPNYAKRNFEKDAEKIIESILKE
jgi:hypothetical protein